MIQTTCYGQVEYWKNREDALARFKECMMCSEGAEHMRYFKIWCELDAGWNYATDEEWATFNGLRTTAKIHCINEFLGKVIPYDFEDVNDGDMDDLEANINEFLLNSDELTIDYDGNWYDEGRKL